MASLLLEAAGVIDNNDRVFTHQHMTISGPLQTAAVMMYTIHIALVLLLLCLSSFAAGRFCSHREYSVSLSLKSWSNPHEMFHVLHALFSLFCLVKEILLFTPVMHGRLSDREQKTSSTFGCGPPNERPATMQLDSDSVCMCMTVQLVHTVL